MKEKVVHTRVSGDLYKKISSKAKNHGVTISNLVRNIVEDSLEISGDVLGLIDQKVKKNLYKSESILGYQPLTLIKDTTCNLCGKELGKGTRANIAFLEGVRGKITVCDSCRKENE